MLGPVVSPSKCLNKVGHALHMQPGPFHDIVTSAKSKAVLKALDYTTVRNGYAAA